jgi:hypothetical protein
MINQLTVESAFLNWMQEFVEVPHANLGNWPPCPYARQARLSNNIDIRQGVDPYADCLSLLYYDWSKEAVIFWYNDIDPTEFADEVARANNTLLAKDIVALEDHPATDEIISDVKMNFGYCPIIVLQQNSKLNQSADQLRAKGYYKTWSQKDLDKIVSWRYSNL